MSKEEALEILRTGNVLVFESWEWSKWSYQCNGSEDGYVCCYKPFNSPEDSLEHLEMMCEGKWDEVEEL